MAFVLYNISDEIVRREQAGIVYQEGGNRVCILFQEKWSRDFTAKTKGICREIKDKMKEVMGIDVSMGIGDWVKNPGELILSHDMAAQVMQYRYLLGGDLLIDMAEQRSVKVIPLDRLLEELTEALKTGKKEQVESAFQEMKDSICQALVEKSRACMYLQQIVRTIDRVCEDVSVDMKRILSGRDELLHSITKQKSFDSACRIVEDYIMKIFKLLSDMNSSTGQRQARLAMNYIQKNYMDPDLSLNDICSYLNISTSYFSTIFKEMTGETFTEVLIRTRMEKAKELLENTTMKNYEIAEKVGFLILTILAFPLKDDRSHTYRICQGAEKMKKIQPGDLMIKKFKSIQSVIFAVLSVLLLGAVIIITVISLSYTRQSVFENSSLYTQTIIQQMNQNIDSYIDIWKIPLIWFPVMKTYRNIFLGILQHPEARDRILSQFETILDSRSDILNLGIIAENGRMLINNGQHLTNQDLDIHSQEWYTNALEGRESVYLTSSHVQHIISGERPWVITLSRGIRNKEMGTGQEKEGVFFIDLNYSAISELCDQSMVGNQGYAFIVDADGNIVYHPQQQQLYNELQTENIDLV